MPHATLASGTWIPVEGGERGARANGGMDVRFAALFSRRHQTPALENH